MIEIDRIAYDGAARIFSFLSRLRNFFKKRGGFGGTWWLEYGLWQIRLNAKNTEAALIEGRKLWNDIREEDAAATQKGEDRPFGPFTDKRCPGNQSPRIVKTYFDHRANDVKKDVYPL